VRIQFNINYQKALEVILWVLHKDKTIDVYRLMKALFHADLFSVNKYGAPITGDNYLAMKFGTVPDVIYNGLIQKHILYLEDSQLDINLIPFDLKGYVLLPKRMPNIECLSESDIECLELGIKEYTGLSFEQVKNKNHSIRAWRETYHNMPNSFIDWYDLIEEQYLKDDLSDGWSEHMVI
jgi:uncharacterized phage-associated protein